MSSTTLARTAAEEEGRRNLFLSTDRQWCCVCVELGEALYVTSCGSKREDATAPVPPPSRIDLPLFGGRSCEP